MSQRKPLVVLAGWLGCETKKLRRYDQFFRDAGYEVAKTVAPPPLVVQTCYTVTPEPLQYPPGWPYHGWSPTNMQGYAWDMLRHIHNHNCDHFLLYAFSNGGCFVWEQVSRILKQHHLNPGSIATHEDDTTPGDDQKARHKILEDLHHKAAGVIFDSCPSKELSQIPQALNMLTFRERFEIIRMPSEKGGGLDVALFPSLASQEKRDRFDQRGEAYYRGLQADPWNIPQLYLYSENDALIPSPSVDELYEHRRNMIGADRVLRCKFKSSRHCAHLLDNPDEYKAAVTDFLELTRKLHPESPLSGPTHSML